MTYARGSFGSCGPRSRPVDYGTDLITLGGRVAGRSTTSGDSSAPGGRVRAPCQGEGRGFESRRPFAGTPGLARGYVHLTWCFGLSAVLLALPGRPGLWAAVTACTRPFCARIVPRRQGSEAWPFGVPLPPWKDGGPFGRCLSCPAERRSRRCLPASTVSTRQARSRCPNAGPQRSAGRHGPRPDARSHVAPGRAATGEPPEVWPTGYVLPRARM